MKEIKYIAAIAGAMYIGHTQTLEVIILILAVLCAVAALGIVITIDYPSPARRISRWVRNAEPSPENPQPKAQTPS